MRALTRQLPALVAVAAIAAASAACSSSSASPTPSGSATAQGGPAAAGFPVTVTTAGGRTHLASRPGAIVSLSPTATEDLYAVGAGLAEALAALREKRPPVFTGR